MLKYGNQSWSPRGVETIVFPEVYITGEKTGKCKCGVRRVRRQRFSQTINPYNVKKDKEQKMQSDIMPELFAEREAWKKEPITCEMCRVKKGSR